MNARAVDASADGADPQAAADDASDDVGEASTDRSYFTSMYAGAADPWDFDDSWYEQRKYEVTMAVLPRRRYRRAVEPGCANGALTARLAVRCDEVFAYDFVEDAVRRARARLSGQRHVHVGLARFPSWWPEAAVDLVVWSEVAYYLGVDDGVLALDGLHRCLEPGGDLVAVHYTGETNYPRTGDSIGRWLDEAGWLDRLVVHDDEDFSLGVWRRTSDRNR